VPAPTMAARLTRARKALADERFAVPTGAELEARVATVAEVAYLAFTSGYAPGSGADLFRADLAGEAIRLVRVLRSVLPAGFVGTADLDALLALMLLQHARRDARANDGRLVLLPDQDRARWRHDEIAEALALLGPHLGARSTPYLLQAVIAAEHAIAPTAAETDWTRIAGWYAELERLTGSPVVRLNRAVAVSEADGPDAGLRLLDGLELPGHRLPAARAELLARAGLPEEARAQYELAIERCGNEVERAHLGERLSLLRPPE